MHGSKLKHLLKTVLKLFMFAEASVSTYLQINYLPAGGAVVVGNIAVSPVTAVINVMRSNAIYQALTLEERQMKTTSKLF